MSLYPIMGAVNTQPSKGICAGHHSCENQGKTTGTLTDSDIGSEPLLETLMHLESLSLTDDLRRIESQNVYPKKFLVATGMLLVSVVLVFFSAAFSGVFASVCGDPVVAFGTVTEAVITYCESARTTENYREAIDCASSHHALCVGTEVEYAEGTRIVLEVMRIWEEFMAACEFNDISEMRKLQSQSSSLVSMYSFPTQWKLVEIFSQLIKQALPSPGTY